MKQDKIVQLCCLKKDRLKQRENSKKINKIFSEKSSRIRRKHLKPKLWVIFSKVVSIQSLAYSETKWNITSKKKASAKILSKPNNEPILNKVSSAMAKNH